MPFPDIDNTQADSSSINLDPFKFSHGLTGTNQAANYYYVNILVATMFAVVCLRLCYRIITSNQIYRRRISATISKRNKSRSYLGHQWQACWKRHLLYAPLGNHRHRSEITLGKRIRLGSIPLRPQLTVLFIYICSNLAYCLAIPRHNRAQTVAEFRGRCGSLAVFNLIFVILFALRSNPLIWILHISYDTFNLFHRWGARIVFLETCAHICAWAYNTYQPEYDGKRGWANIAWVLSQSESYQWGLTGFLAFAMLLLHSIYPLRHAFYEAFLTIHRLSSIIAICGTYFHIAKHNLPQLSWTYLILSFFLIEATVRMFRILYHNLSFHPRKWTRITIEALPGDATKLSLDLRRPWTANPGSHIHIYIPRIALWSSHPFSVAWSTDNLTAIDAEKFHLPVSTIEDIEIPPTSSTISCIVRARTGMTRTLYNRAITSPPNKPLRMWAAVEGPYGGFHDLNWYSSVVLFAAGVGITHQLPFVRHFLRDYKRGSDATRKVLLVWCVREVEMVGWIREWLDELSAMDGYEEVVRVWVFVSRGADFVGREDFLRGVDIRTGRCDPADILDTEVLTQAGPMVVTVCGPSGFSDCVRAAVRGRVNLGYIDFFEEGFAY